MSRSGVPWESLLSVWHSVEMQVTLGMLLELDKLVQLLESPIFVRTFRPMGVLG